MIYAYIVILIVILVMVTFMVYVILEMWGDIKGAPYVPTGWRDIEKLLEVVKIKPDAKVVELGCGSGRFLRAAASKYEIEGLGVDVNWVLIGWAKLRALLSHVKGVSFECRNMFEVDLKRADVIYVFLLPRSLRKLSEKLHHEARKGTYVISHGFEIVGWSDKLVTRINNHVFDTFVYQV